MHPPKAAEARRTKIERHRHQRQLAPPVSTGKSHAVLRLTNPLCQRHVISQKQQDFISCKTTVTQITANPNGDLADIVKIGMGAPTLMAGDQPGKILSVPCFVTCFVTYFVTGIAHIIGTGFRPVFTLHHDCNRPTPAPLDQLPPELRPDDLRPDDLRPDDLCWLALFPGGLMCAVSV